jgi:YggT family protein
MVLNMIQLVVFASVIISWLNAPPNNQIVGMVRAITEPMYRPLRKMTRRFGGPIDWAPLIIILVIVFLQRSIVPWLRSQAMY